MNQDKSDYLVLNCDDPQVKELAKETKAKVVYFSKTKDLNPNMWDTRFGGHVKTGETVEDTALEELKEEIGVNVQISDLIFGDVYKHDGFPNREFNIVYYYNFQGDITSLKFNDGEVQEIKWMETQEIIQSMRNTPGNWTGKSEKFLKIVEILIAKMNS